MWENFTRFFAEPFNGNENMNAVDWFLFTGLIIACVVIWNLVLIHIKEGLA
jgi:hypothetical protein